MTPFSASLWPRFFPIRPLTRIGTACLWTLLVGVFALTAGCDTVTSTDDGPTVFMWIGADQDAFVSCGRRVQGVCSNGNLAYPDRDFLSVTLTEPLDRRYAYVHFDLPRLPDGSEIKEAYLELHSDGSRLDGQTGVFSIPAGRAGAQWAPRTLTFNNQPNPSTAGAEFTIRFHEGAWSGSENIEPIVRALFDDPSSNHGFRVFWPGPQTPFNKGFHSINHRSRSRDDLGLGPRLLVKVQLPAGADATDIQLRPLLSRDSDLDLPGNGPILMIERHTGTDWPASWTVTRGV